MHTGGLAREIHTKTVHYTKFPLACLFTRGATRLTWRECGFVGVGALRGLDLLQASETTSRGLFSSRARRRASRAENRESRTARCRRRFPDRETPSRARQAETRFDIAPSPEAAQDFSLARIRPDAGSNTRPCPNAPPAREADEAVPTQTALRLRPPSPSPRERPLRPRPPSSRQARELPHS